MAIQFPNLIDFMDEYGMNELHNIHKDHQNAIGDKIPFADFVQGYYEMFRDEWDTEMFYTTKLVMPKGEEDDISLQTAKDVFIQIFNRGQEEMDAGHVITEQDLAPCHHAAEAVVSDFHNILIPAIQKFLNEYKG